MNSLLNMDDGHFLNCRKAVKMGGLNLLQGKDESLASSCVVCKCSCQVTYQKSNRFKIALVLERHKKTIKTDKPLKDSVSFFSTL